MVVWAENWNIVEVFTRCHWRSQFVAGATELVRIFEGIEATEVAAVAAMLNVPPSRNADLLWGVRVMQEVALPILNRR